MGSQVQISSQYKEVGLKGQFGAGLWKYDILVDILEQLLVCKVSEIFIFYTFVL